MQASKAPPLIPVPGRGAEQDCAPPPPPPRALMRRGGGRVPLSQHTGVTLRECWASGLQRYILASSPRFWGCWRCLEPLGCMAPISASTAIWQPVSLCVSVSS